MWSISYLEDTKHIFVASELKPMVVQNTLGTSRIHGKKEPQSFFHCGAFDHHDLQSMHICFFGFMTANLKSRGM